MADLYTSCEFVDRAIDNATSTQLLLVKKQVLINSPSVKSDPSVQVGERLSVLPASVSPVPVDNPHVELGWEGLDSAKAAVTTLGSLTTSSCIPSLCTTSR